MQFVKSRGAPALARRLAATLVGASCGVSLSVAHAQEPAGSAPAPSEPPPATAPAGATPEAPQSAAFRSLAWDRRYGIAKDLLIAGRFLEAQQAFTELVATATKEEERRLASELADVAAQYIKSGNELVGGQELAESAIVARRKNRRTTDEISVLYVNGVAYGLGTGLFVSTLTEPDNAAGYALPMLLLGGAGAGAVALIDRGDGLGYGVPQSIVSGMYLGLGEGAVWSIWNQARVHYYEEWSDKTVATVLWGSATVGAVAGGAVATLYGATPGRASYVGSTGLWTSAVGGLMASAFVKDHDSADDTALLTAAVGLNVGAVAGVLTAGKVSPSIARVRFLDLGGIAGGLIAAGLYLSVADRDAERQVGSGVVGVGTAAGLVSAWFLTNGMAEDRLANETPQKATSIPTPLGLSIGPVPGGATLGMYGLL